MALAQLEVPGNTAQPWHLENVKYRLVPELQG